MIRRISEYIIYCDAKDCRESIAYSVTTREQCQNEALKDGWQPCTYKRWLCRKCAAMAERQFAEK